jgi:hypothetical protein
MAHNQQLLAEPGHASCLPANLPAYMPLCLPACLHACLQVIHPRNVTIVQGLAGLSKLHSLCIYAANWELPEEEAEQQLQLRNFQGA